MTNPTAQLDVAGILAEAEAATAGPWQISALGEMYHGGMGCTPDGCPGHELDEGTWVIANDGAELLNEYGDGDGEEYSQFCKNANFIANARTNVPALCREVLSLQSENAALRKALGEAAMAKPKTGVPLLDDAINRLMSLDNASALALIDVAEERIRQISIEGWNPAHDDGHSSGEMSRAAACYALAPHTARIPSAWPWAPSRWKPHSLHRNRVRAAALLVAELARHLRSAGGERRAERRNATIPV
jgi:hypothetical protein